MVYCYSVTLVFFTIKCTFFHYINNNSFVFCSLSIFEAKNYFQIRKRLIITAK